MHERLQTQRRSALSLAMTNTDFLRRKCACGIGPGADGECAECRSKKASLQRYAINQAEPSTVSPVVPAVLRSYGHSVSTTSRAFAEPCFGHNFSQVPVYATAAERVTAGSASGTVDRTEMPLAAESVDPEVDLLEDEAAMVVPPEPLDSLEKKPSCCQFTSFTASNDSYTDTDTDTRKNIRFTCSVKPGSAPKKCVMVNWVQGTAKNKDRTFRKAKVFDKIVDINFPKEQIDSIDKDPVYWSDAGGRWNYRFTVGTGDEFFAEDSPGPQVWVDGMDYDLKYKMCLYCIDDVSPISDESGSGVKNPLKCINWVFKARYDAAAKKFTH